MVRSSTCLSLVLLFAFSIKMVATETPYIQFTEFKGDAIAAISMTFDDGLPSQLKKAIPILDKHGLNATFFIHTDNIKPTWASTWDAWLPVVKSGHEVGSHTKSHPALSELSNSRRIRDEIEGSADLIEQKLGVRPISFAYPFSDVNDVIRRKVRDEYFIDRDSCRMWGGAEFTAADGIESIEKAVEKGAWLYCMMHGVDDSSFRSIVEKEFAGIVEYLAENRETIWTDTYSNIGLYTRERILVDLKLKNICKGGFMLRLDIPKDVRFRKYMNKPLTLKIDLDGRDVKLVKVYQDDKVVMTSIARDGKSFLMDIIPDSKWVQVYWGK